jgi:D-alanine-D-alanine ligase
MPHFNLKNNNPLNIPIKVWVLSPFVHTNDENLDYYYDFSQSISEYSKTFKELGLQWKWQPVTMDDYVEIILGIVSEKEKNISFPIVLNICDGDEVNGTPGISVLKLLEDKELIYTGAEAFFYDITTSKIVMKRAFDAANIPTAKWEPIQYESQNINGIFDRLGTPIIVKPSVSGGSMGVGTKNVVYNEAELNDLVKKMFEGYRGWNLVTDGLIAESFITGPEYTSFIVGSYNKPQKAIIYEPVERIFHSSLPEDEKFLSFDRLWEIYEEETAMPNEENFYEYEKVNPDLVDEIKKLSWDAYASLKGTGYTRIDIRKDKTSGKLYVLEANAQCGISEDENYTSIGAILKMTGKTFTELVTEIITEAIDKYKFSSVNVINEVVSLVNNSSNTL